MRVSEYFSHSSDDTYYGFSCVKRYCSGLGGNFSYSLQFIFRLVFGIHRFSETTKPVIPASSGNNTEITTLLPTIKCKAKYNWNKAGLSPLPLTALLKPYDMFPLDSTTAATCNPPERLHIAPFIPFISHSS
jgi:hypothetical protein